MALSTTWSKIGVPLAGIAAAGLVHVGALGDDLARTSRLVLHHVGVGHEAIRNIDDGARVMNALRSGDDAEQAAVTAGCRVVDASIEQSPLGEDAEFAYSHADWKAAVEEEMSGWVIGEATGSVDNATNTVATAMTVGQVNVMAGVLYARYCFGS